MERRRREVQVNVIALTLVCHKLQMAGHLKRQCIRHWMKPDDNLLVRENCCAVGFRWPSMRQEHITVQGKICIAVHNTLLIIVNVIDQNVQGRLLDT